MYPLFPANLSEEIVPLLIVSESCVLLLMKENIEQITAGSPMVGTPIILVWRPISLGLIKEEFFPALLPFQRSLDSNGMIT